MRAMGLPMGFGMKKKATKIVLKTVPPIVHPTVPREVKREVRIEPAAHVNREIPENSSSGSSDDEESNLLDQLPFASFCSLNDHTRTVTAMSVDPAHSRLLTAGRDNYVKLWDFQTMRGNFKPFHTIEPAEGSPIKDVQWGIKGDCFLVAPGNWQPMLVVLYLI